MIFFPQARLDEHLSTFFGCETIQQILEPCPYWRKQNLIILRGSRSWRQGGLWRIILYHESADGPNDAPGDKRRTIRKSKMTGRCNLREGAYHGQVHAPSQNSTRVEEQTPKGRTRAPPYRTVLVLYSIGAVCLTKITYYLYDLGTACQKSRRNHS